MLNPKTSLLDTYGAYLDAQPSYEDLYENPVKDNVADFSDFKKNEAYQGPGERQSGQNMTQLGSDQDMLTSADPMLKEKLKKILMLKARDRRAASEKFQGQVELQNKHTGVGPSAYDNTY